MFSAVRALTQATESEARLPQPADLAPLWEVTQPRYGQVIMVAGRPGSYKSGFALFWTHMMGLPTLYLSADTSAGDMTRRLAQMELGKTEHEVEAMEGTRDGMREILEAVGRTKITFSFDNPIRWVSLWAELEAYVELYNRFPAVVVIDNLMDIDASQSDYEAQTFAMQEITSMAREHGITMLVLHHATDKSAEARLSPGLPPSRGDIKNGLGEKPNLTLTVALEPTTNRFRVATVKQRSGKSDPAASEYVELQAYPHLTRFTPKGADWARKDWREQNR